MKINMPASFLFKASSSKGSSADFFGLILIGLGVLALLGMAYVSYMKSFSPIPAPPPKVANTEQPIELNKHAALKDFTFAAANQLEGVWGVQIKDRRAVVLFLKDMYQITYTSDSKGEIRRYTRGTFTYDEKTGKLTLTPNVALGQPDPVPNVIFKLMTTTPFDIYVLTKKNTESNEKKNLYWIPPENMIASRQIHPLFPYMILVGQPLLKWLPVEDEKKTP